MQMSTEHVTALGDQPVERADTTAANPPRSNAWMVMPALYLVLVVALYFSVLQTTAVLWWNNDNYSHGMLIFPLAIALVWAQRKLLRQTEHRSAMVGVPVLAIGLFMLAVSEIFQVRYIGYWSLTLTLSGAVLALYGNKVFRIVAFPIGFVLFAGAIPNSLLSNLTLWIRNVSTTGATVLMKAIGFSVLQLGNLIQIPGMTLEVADVCSGYKKLTALLAFAALYSYVYALRPIKWITLIGLAIPIAMLSNIARISGLIAVGSFGGPGALKVAHEYADYVALAFAVSVFVLIGKGFLGCRETRYHAQSA